MANRVQQIQAEVLEAVARADNFPFALAGGTALERYYLHHRFSRDLDFFSPVFEPAGVEEAVECIRDRLGYSISKEQEFIAERHAMVIFYSLSTAGLERPLKIDFVEDVIIRDPAVRKIEGVPVYGVEDIYFHKIVAVTGVGGVSNAAGRPMPLGRSEPRDAFDLYALSRKVRPLHVFLREVPRMYQRLFVRWAKTYSRIDMKIGLLDLDIYLEGFDAREMILHIDDEVGEFMRGVA